MLRQKVAGFTKQGQGTQPTVKDWNELLRDKCHADCIWTIMAAQKAAEGAFCNTEEKVIASMFSGIWKSRCLSVLVSLGIPELLCESSESVSIQEIAKRTGCRTDEQIYKIMRTMAQWGIGEEISGKRSFKANKAMELLRSDKGPSLGHMVAYYGSDEVWSSMLVFPDAVKNGVTAFELAHGMNIYDYMYKVDTLEYVPGKATTNNLVRDLGSQQRRCEFAHNYDRAMNMLSQLELLSSQPSVFTVYPWGKCKQIMDIGGGEGQFLSCILKLPGCEHVNGVLFDFPDVIERAKKFLAKEGIPDNRITFTMGNILKDVPQSTEVDTIIVKNLFVIFTDDEMIKVLENCHEVLIKGGKFIIVNSCNPEAGDTEHNVTSSGLHPGFRGIHIMTLCKTGRFRTKSEWLLLINRLCCKVAFKLNQVFDTGDGPTLFELLKCD